MRSLTGKSFYMKVLILTYPAIGLNRGGLQIQIEETIRGLQAKGVEASRYDPWRNQLSAIDVLHAFSIDCSIAAYIRRAHSRNIPIVISPVFNAFANPPILTRIKKRLSDVIPGMYSDLKRASFMLSVAHKIVCLNADERNLLVKTFNIDKIRACCIPNGVSRAFATGDAALFQSKLGIRDFVLQVGSIEVRKNQLTLIRAMRNLPYALVIVGSASADNEQYLRECRAAAGDKVVFLGALDRNDPMLAAAYSAAKVFVLPSYSEVMPLVLYEAAMAGCRIVVSDKVPVAKELSTLVRRVDPNDVDAMAKVIEKEIRTPRDPSMLRAVSGMPTWDLVCDSLIGIYEEVAKTSADGLRDTVE